MAVCLSNLADLWIVALLHMLFRKTLEQMAFSSMEDDPHNKNDYHPPTDPV